MDVGMQGSHLTLSGRYRRNNGCWRNAAHDVLSPASLKAPHTPTVDDNSADTLRSDTGVQTETPAPELVVPPTCSPIPEGFIGIR
jgi:hypothetical protein